MKLPLFLALVINLVSAQHEMYTVCLDNSSLLAVPELLAPSTGSYISFKDDCCPKSESKKPNKIKVRVFPSFPLLKQVGGRKKLITHISQLFAESNKIFVNQLNIRLVPETIIPKESDAAPINGGINVIGDLNLFGTFLSSKSRAPVNLFVTNNYVGIVGAAYIGTLGSTNFNYAVSINKDSVISHELLHVFGAQHTFGKGGVMSYTDRLINGLLQMHPDNKPQVCSILDYYFKNKV
jgi:hypothetical protein